MYARIIFMSLLIGSISIQAQNIPNFDIQGHRGCRGLRPENSIPAFLMALDSGVTTLELDVVISKDSQVVVSHDPWMSKDICIPPDNQPFDSNFEANYNIYQMNYEQIKKWDCGSMGNVDFPEQQALKTIKPLLKDVIIAVENHIKSVSKYEVDYSIEIKSSLEGDNKFHPTVTVFAELVYNLINQYLPLERVVIQSFDFRMLKYWHNKYPEVRLSALVENNNSVNANLKSLGFIPSVYSPYFKLISQNDVIQLHKKKYSYPTTNDKDIILKERPMRVIPWTVNMVEDMRASIAMGVDGIITDFPNRAKKYVEELNLKENNK